MVSDRPLRRALYLQVRDTLVERIASREWQPGTAVPNENDLARALGVSAGTVRKALSLMEEERLITRRQGKGTFVNDQASNKAAARFHSLCGPNGERIATVATAVEVAEGTVGEQGCRRLGLHAGAAVYRIRRLRRLGGRNVMVENATLPAALFPDLGGKSESCDDLIVLAQKYGILLGRVEERVFLAVPPSAAAAPLGVAPGMPVMVLDRVTFTLSGRPVERRLAYCHLAGSFYLAEMG